MATKKQIAANRRNAKRSTGPKTEKGKAIARMNRLSNALHSRNDTLPAENWQEIFQIRDRFLESWQPQTGDQHRLVAQAACAQWKLLHWQRVHAQLLQEAADKAGPRRQDRLRREFASRQARLEQRLRQAYEQLATAAGPQPDPAAECLPAA